MIGWQVMFFIDLRDMDLYGTLSLLETFSAVLKGMVGSAAVRTASGSG
jgi:hypothetical protein